MTADLPDDLDILVAPGDLLELVGPVALTTTSMTCRVYFDARSEMAVNRPDQPVNFHNADAAGIKAWRVGTVEQHDIANARAMISALTGVISTSPRQRHTHVLHGGQWPRLLAMHSRRVPGCRRQPRKNIATTMARNDSVIAFAVNLGAVQSKATSCWLMLAYDDLYSIQYMKKNLRPYWRRNGWEAADLLQAAARDYASLQKRCAAFDDELMADLRNAGGENYARLGALAYRQCFAAGKFVADDQRPAVAVLQGEPLQRLHQHLGRVLSDVAAVSVVRPHAGQVVHGAVS